MTGSGDLRLPQGMGVEELIGEVTGAAWGAVKGLPLVAGSAARYHDLCEVAVQDALTGALRPAGTDVEGRALLRFADSRADFDRLCAIVAYQVVVVAFPYFTDAGAQHDLADRLPAAIAESLARYAPHPDRALRASVWTPAQAPGRTPAVARSPGPV